MSTLKPRSPLDAALANIPAEFRNRIVKSYLELKARHAESKHDAAGLSAGKFCESVVRLLQHELKKQFTPFGQRILSLSDECDSFAKLPRAAGNDSLRIVIPRAVSLLYTLRNKRGIGHVGGDVDANAIDGMTISRVADWVMCELIRVFHKMSLEEADALVSSLASRDMCRVHDFVSSRNGFFEPLPKGSCLHFVSSQRRVKFPKPLVGQIVPVKEISHGVFQMRNAFIDECLCQRSLCCNLTSHVGYNNGYACTAARF